MYRYDSANAVRAMRELYMHAIGYHAQVGEELCRCRGIWPCPIRARFVRWVTALDAESPPLRAAS